MRIDERSYSAKAIRPRPSIYTEPDGSFMVISTSWGLPQDADRVNEDVAKYIQASKADVEVTSPFEFLSSLTNDANYLRIAALISNESLYRGANKNDYTSGVETLLLLRNGQQMAFAQVGAPHLLIQKNGKDVVPVSVSFEASFEMARSGEELLAPLPQNLLGVDSSLNIRAGDFLVSEGDRLILYAGGVWPESLWSSDPSADLQSFTQKIVQINPESPFWLGIVSLED